MSKMVWFAAFFIFSPFLRRCLPPSISSSPPKISSAGPKLLLFPTLTCSEVAALITAVSVAAKAAKWFAATELSVRHANAIKALEEKIMIGILARMGPKSTAPFVDKVVHLCQQIYDAKNDIDFPQ